MTLFAFDGAELTPLEAVALRDRLTLAARTRRSVIAAVEDALETGKSARNLTFGQTRRSKDDIRRVATIDIKAARAAADNLSERVRRLDLALQQQNWTTDLVD